MNADDVDLVNAMIRQAQSTARPLMLLDATVASGGEPGNDVTVVLDRDNRPDVANPTSIPVRNETGVTVSSGDRVKVASQPDASGAAIALIGASASIFDTGDLMPSLASSKPGWLKMNGATIPTDSTGDRLRALLAGLGLGTATTPAWTDYVLAQAGSLVALGAIAGSSTHAITKTELPAYNLTVVDTHTHPIGSANVSPDAVANGLVAAHQEPGNSGNATSGPPSAPPTVSSGGGSVPMSLVQRTAGVNWFIKL